MWFWWLFLSVCLFLLYLRISMGKCRSSRRLEGKTVIVTGANTGIGKETALDLARRGARVILACRDLTRAEEARKHITYTTGNSDVVVVACDLSKLKSVRRFCEHILNNEQRLDILVNNAGIGLLSNKTLTEDGLELTMATNHFGHFMLTNLLIGLMNKTGEGRIVNVSSGSYRLIDKMDMDNLNSEKSYSRKVYMISKLANIYFTTELAEKLRGTGITANCLHPGVVNTEFGRNLPTYIRTLAKPFTYFMKSSKDGAQTSIYLAVSEEVEGVSGKYFRDCKETRLSSVGRDKKAAEELWERSNALCRLSAEECL